MTEIKIKVSDEKARRIKYYLCDLYKKNKNTGLNKLCEIAVLKEVARQAQNELDNLNFKE